MIRYGNASVKLRKQASRSGGAPTPALPTRASALSGFDGNDDDDDVDL